MKFKINLIKIGRNDKSKQFTEEFSHLEDAEIFAFHQVKKYLISNDVSMYNANDDDGFYNVYSGTMKVGKVRIQEIQ